MPYGITTNSVDVVTGEILIYGDIVDAKWLDTDVTPKDFKDEMDKLNDKKIINVYINSGGGGVFPGMAIHNILKRAKAETFAFVDGIAASIASVILQGAKNRIVTKGSMVMIHNPSSVAWGDAGVLRKTADALDKVKEAIVSAYSDRTKMKEVELRAMMDEETWMTGEEAVTFGFADTLTDGKEYTNCIDLDGTAIFNGQKIDISKFRSFPKNSLPMKKVESNTQEMIVAAPTYTDIEAQLQISNAKRKNFNF
jgi:ATP-dependent Clp protease, protease subunit